MRSFQRTSLSFVAWLGSLNSMGYWQKVGVQRETIVFLENWLMILRQGLTQKLKMYLSFEMD